MKKEKPSCPFCSSIHRVEAYSWSNSYKVVRCCSCSFYYLFPRIVESAMLDIYSDDSYFEGGLDGYESYSEQRLSLTLTFRKLLSNMEKHGLTGGDVLDVGCGYGFFLGEALGLFDMRVGTDFSPLAARQASLRADLVYCGGVDAIPAGQSFDIVVSTHVIEHVYKPDAFIQDLTKCLKPGGFLLVATPDMGGFWRHLMGNKWPLFKLPEHILYFNQNSLCALMERNGVKDIKKIPYPHAFPLPLVASKLGVKISSNFSRFSLWLPATTIALYGRI